MGRTNVSKKTPRHAEDDGAPKLSDAQAAYASRKAAQAVEPEETVVDPAKKTATE